MDVFRIVQQKYADDLSGFGSYTYGGRWNSVGTYALYTSTTRALALLELLAHIPIQLLKSKKYVLMTLEIPDGMDAQNLTFGMNSDANMTTRGDIILQLKRELYFTVPSILVPEELNIIINPLYRDFSKVMIKSQRIIDIDGRLFGQ